MNNLLNTNQFFSETQNKTHKKNVAEMEKEIARERDTETEMGMEKQCIPQPSTDVPNKENPKKKSSIIGIFHYSQATLKQIFDKTPKHLVYDYLYQFYIPISVVSYSHEKVVQRRIWVASKNRYCTNSDLVPLIIHSSTYVPDLEKKNENRQPLGIIMTFQYLDVNSPKFIMRRKNGIRSRYCSKSFDKVVEIINFKFVEMVSQIPLEFLKLGDYHKKHLNNGIKKDNSSKTNCTLKKLNGKSNKRKRSYHNITISHKSKKKIILKKLIKNKPVFKKNKIQIKEHEQEQQPQKPHQPREPHEPEPEQQQKTQNKNIFQNDQQIEKPKIDHINHSNRIKPLLTKEEFEISEMPNKSLFRENYLKSHFDFELKQSVETTFFQDINQEFWDSLKSTTFGTEDNVFSPLEQYQFNFNNDYDNNSVPYKNDDLFDENFLSNYEFDYNLLF
ncbi:enolase-phosphatase e1 [Anaeramoeba flamelloides]|uniref:Enolase-phosphatase e1 n=1 Tax=Anaeramoeba flamelloides TaxID=1746091 RepID=A0AAV7ZTI4_9EUKA|nr:enolase-phosphatase e1 [Anaeramoeba flamelloides]